MMHSLKKVATGLLMSCGILANAAPVISIAPNSPVGKAILQHYANHPASLTAQIDIIKGFQTLCSVDYGITVINESSVTECFASVAARALATYAHCGSCGPHYIYVHNGANECVMC